MAKGRRKSAKRPSQRTGAAARPRPARARGVATAAADESTEAQLKRALADAHDAQAATSEVLKLISASPRDLKPVFEAILEHATRICEAKFGLLHRYRDGAFHIAAMVGVPPALAQAILDRGAYVPPPGISLDRLLRTKSAVHILDQAQEKVQPPSATLGGARSHLSVPMIKDGEIVGAFTLYRTEVRPFSDKQIDLMQNFAAQAVIAIENTRLLSELRESIQQQAAASEVLRVISSSPGELQPVLDTIVQTAARLCKADFAMFFILRDGKCYVGAANAEAEIIKVAREHPIVPTRASCTGRAVLERRTIHVLDASTDPEYAMPDYRLVADNRTMLGVPLLREGVPLGTITLWKTRVEPFTEKQIELITTFADQALIAIENVRLFEAEQQRMRELSESLQQQTATADVLKVISRSTFDLPAVLDTLVASACRLCEADIGTIRYHDGEDYRLAATYGCTPEWRQHFASYSTRPDRGSVFGRTIVDGETVHIPDVLADRDYTRPQAQKLMGLRAALGVPLVREGRVFGVVNLFRSTPRPFTQKQIELAETFADQAVIAIENTRLFEAEQRRSAELSESLEQQTATSEVLKVIGRSAFDLQPVFDTMAENAVRLCEAERAFIFRFDGEVLRAVASYNVGPETREWVYRNPITLGRHSVSARAALGRRTVQVADIQADPEYAYAVREVDPIRTTLAVPMLKGDELVGTITIFRFEVKPFTDKQVALVETFAAQAVIAIENTRLFEAEQQRSAELSESLEQQTATSEVLKVIGRSAFDLQPVFDTMAENAVRLCEAERAFIFRFDGEVLRAVASYNAGPENREWVYRNPIAPGRHSVSARAALGRRTVQVPDVQADPEYAYVQRDVDPIRTTLAVPMLKGDELVGTITIYRLEVKPFTDKQVALVETFADQAVIAIENVRLFDDVQKHTRDLSEALEQQTATSEVLRVISSSPGELEPVFQAMLANATRICEAKIGILWGFDNGAFGAVAMRGISPEYAEYLNSGPIRPSPTTGLGRLISTQQTIHIVDTLAEQAYAERDPFRVATAELGGARTLLNVPMLKEGKLIGAIGIYRQEVKPFSDKQVELVTNFAAQAVIAIENTRLLNELRETLERQTATSEVLKVISSSPGELAPVFQAMLENATRICEANFGTLLLCEGDALRAVALHGGEKAYADERRRNPVFRPSPNVPVARALRTKQVEHVTDLRTEQAYIERDKAIVTMVEAAGARTFLAVPMLKDEKAVGAVIIYRQEVRPFSNKQIELVQNFAAQAVIAIENTRLLNELRQRTDDLTESLEQQTATSEVLQVISSSPGELEPVFNAMLENATRICEAKFGNLFLFEGNTFRAVAVHGASNYAEWTRREPVVDMAELEHFGTPLFRVARDKALIHIPDLRMDESYVNGNPRMKSLVETAGARTHLVVPMLKDEELIGAIVMYRQEMRPFSNKQIELVQNFAAQAVIAIENTRLLNELRQRTDDLTESLEQQTATSEVLRTISSSPGELKPVFDAMLANATRICGASFGNMLLREGDVFRRVALHNATPEYLEFGEKHPFIDPRNAPSLNRVLETKSAVQVPDMAVEEPESSATKFGHARTLLAVPMLKESQLVGVIGIYRQVLQPFSQKQIELVQNFAAQAVIAIENTRLLSELRESLEQQTATADVLKVISTSPGELEPVFNAMLDNATRLCDAKYGILYLAEGDGWRTVAMHDVPAAFAKERQNKLVRPPPDSSVSRAKQAKQAVQTADIRTEQSYIDGNPHVVTTAELGGMRTVLCVPMLKDDNVVGVIAIYRQEVRPFTDKQTDLVTNFAAQAVIAIENARLLNELRETLERQTATSEVLKVISSSPGELEPVFAAMLENAVRICGAKMGTLFLSEGKNSARAVAQFGTSPEYAEDIKRRPVIELGEGALGRCARTKQPVQIADVLVDPAYLNDPPRLAIMKLNGARTIINVPMLKDEEVIGQIAIYRQEVRPFADKQVELVANFAAQAVIAIENTRLLNELRQRTDDLTESLQQQTATSDILEVISNSPTDSQPAFDAIVRSGLKLFPEAVVVISLPDGDQVKLAAIAGADAGDLTTLSARYPMPLSREFITGTALLDGREMDFADAREAPEHLMPGRQNFLASGYRAITVMPMMRGATAIGSISVIHRQPRALTDKQRELLRTFAAQAVIAIENTRLFNELRQRTDDLTESLEQQTATSEVLQVISSSPGELEPVFNAMLANATRICEAEFGNLFLREGPIFRAVAVHNKKSFEEYLRPNTVVDLRENPGVPLDRVAKTKQVVHIPNLRADQSYLGKNRFFVALVEIVGARTFVSVPMLKEGELIGAINVYRQEVRPFTDKQIELVKNFAAQAVIAIENTRLLNELRQRTDDLTESLDQQTATAEILQVINSSPGNLAPVFDAMAESAMRVCQADYGHVYSYDGKLFHLVAAHGEPRYLDWIRRSGPRTPENSLTLERVVGGDSLVHIADIAEDPAYRAGNPRARTIVDEFDIHTLLSVALRKDDALLGAFVLYRLKPRPFADKQLALVKTFAAQAVIAIENTRLFNELRQRTDDLTESLQQQTATADVLKVISRSTFDLPAVLNTLLESAARLCRADRGAIRLARDGEYRAVSLHGYPPEHVEYMKSHPVTPARSSVAGRVALEGKAVHVADVAADHELTMLQAPGVSRVGTILGVPLLREGTPIGMLLMSRTQVEPFSDKQIELINTFADQAVIAIENVRLFDEVKARTEDLAESLQQQTATADVLKLISRSTFDLQTVLSTLVQSAARLCEADKGVIFQQDGDVYRLAANVGFSQEAEEYASKHPLQPGRASLIGRTAMGGKVTHIPDVLKDPEYKESGYQKVFGYRTMLGVPLLREGTAIGVFALTRDEVSPFTEKQIELVTTFADQALIAIENVRLFEEVQKRTEDLAESLAQQTATADVLKVISRSTFDLQAVLDTLVESAARLCEADSAAIHRPEGDAYPYVASYGLSREYDKHMREHPIVPGRGTVLGRAVTGGRPVQVNDVTADPEYTMTEGQRLGGFRTVLGVPLMREGIPIGVIMLTRNTVRPFSDKQIELASTFADQAAIAIENVRLFDEIQDKSRQLEEASQHKSQFLANMSHELRTPLNAILGYTELIADGVYGAPPDKMLAVLKRLETNGRHLLGLINDVLDLSKIEAGQLTLSLSDYSMKDVVHSVYGAVEPLAAEKKLNFKAEIAPDMSSGLGDERRLTQVLLNLVGNAIKFTDEGEIVIKASQSNGTFSVAVCDTGPGISEDDQKKLFQEFQQADSSTTKKKGGTGLGLAISKRIIEMHGGKIWLESQVGRGSTFAFTVPTRAEQQTKRQA